LNYSNQFGFIHGRSTVEAIYFIMWWSDIRHIKRTCT